MHRPALHLALHAQPRLGVGVADEVSNLVFLGGLQSLHRMLPLGKQFGRGLVAIDKREGRHVAAAELMLNPAFHIGCPDVNRHATLRPTYVKEQHGEGCQKDNTSHSLGLKAFFF